MDRQCSSCGGICKKSGCERENVTEKKKWVGLTADEIAHIEDMTLDKGDAIRLTAVALMEKNT